MFQMLAASDPVTMLVEFLTDPQYDSIRTALREIGGFLAGVASVVGGRRGIHDLMRMRRAPAPAPTPIGNRTDIEAQQGFNRWLMSENARLNLALSAKDRECDDLEQSVARLTGVNETLRAIVNEDELPVDHPALPPAAD